MPTEPIKLLLVDDVDDNLVALEALLRRDGLEIFTAASGAGALELLLLHDISLALVDVQMPDMDGFELAELMRGTDRTRLVPIIFVTAGTGDPKRVFKGYESGAVDFLFKPIEPHVLKSKVDVFVELALRRQDLASALRLNEMFIAVVGHDLRNPLGTLCAGVDLLQAELVEPEQRTTLARMASAADRMIEMIEQLLDLTQARLGKRAGFSLIRKRVAVGEIVLRVIEELRMSNPGREIALDAAGPCTATGDPERLLQLFSNVIGNAVVHGAPGGMVLATVATTSGEVEVQVRNKGVIPAELLATLFEPFHARARTSRAKRSSGLGLGMYIARQLALAHGGDVTVETLGDETIVKVQLPTG